MNPEKEANEAVSLREKIYESIYDCPIRVSQQLLSYVRPDSPLAEEHKNRLAYVDSLVERYKERNEQRNGL